MYFECSIAIRYSPIIFTGKYKVRKKRRWSVNMPDPNRKRRQNDRGKHTRYLETLIIMYDTLIQRMGLYLFTDIFDFLR